MVKGLTDKIFTGLATWLSSKAEWLEPLSNRTEQVVASSHIFFHFFIGVACVIGAMLVNFKPLAYLSIPAFIFVLLNELPDSGDLLGWLTRSIGWLAGVLFSLLYIVKG